MGLVFLMPLTMENMDNSHVSCAVNQLKMPKVYMHISSVLTNFHRHAGIQVEIASMALQDVPIVGKSLVH